MGSGAADRWDQALAVQRRAAAGFGLLVAQELMAPGEALAALEAAAAQAAPGMDAGGRRTRLAWWLRDGEQAAVAARREAAVALRRVLAPLLAERRASAELIAAAREASAANGEVLRPGEVLDEVRAEVALALRRRFR